MGKKGHRGSRSSESGKFVTPEYAKKHPKTTQNENIPNPGKGTSDQPKKK
jgi:hypothetical protein